MDDLAAAAGLKVSNTSAQLKTLAEAGLVTSRRAGTRVFYRLASPQVAVLAELVKQVAVDWLPAAREAACAWVGDDTGLQPVTRAELALRMRAGSVLVLDVRPAAEYAAGHIAGAVSIPLPALPASLDRLPRDTEIVAYCRLPRPLLRDVTGRGPDPARPRLPGPPAGQRPARMARRRNARLSRLTRPHPPEPVGLAPRRYPPLTRSPSHRFRCV